MEQPLFELMTATGINFENTVIDGKLDNSFLFRNFYNGGGVAIGDINNDGLADVLLTSNMADNKLYLNKGGFKFDDITAKSGMNQDSMWSTGVVFADINNDGWLDIYICNSGHMSTGRRRNKLFINNHDLSFTESSMEYGLDISAYSTQVSFFDYDRDGDLDCFLINNSPIPVNQLNFSNRRDLPEADWPVGDFLKGGGDHLYRNDNQHYVEVTKSAGIHGSLISFGLGVSVGDINQDGWPDVYVSNDSYERDYLYINQKNGSFKDEFEQWFMHTSMSSMGTDIADINNDGYPDLFTTDMLPGDDFRLKTTAAFDNIDLFNSKEKAGFYFQFVKNCLQLNNKNGKFIDIGDYSGVSATDWSWGELLFDADNDGLNDIYVCNGVNRDVVNLDFLDFFAGEVYQKMVLSGKKDSVESILEKIPQTPLRNKMYHNLGNLRFADSATAWGFTNPSFSNGAAYGDLDNDGDLDLIINNENQPAFIYKNNAQALTNNNYIGVFLKGSPKNTFAVGSTIKIYAANQVFSRDIIPSRGFQSCVDYKQIIGLGKIAYIDSMVVIWPGGNYSKIIHPAVNKVYHINENEEKLFPYNFAPQPAGQTLFSLEKNIFEKHTEDDYVDFYYERNLPEILSREGPKAATADVNNDKLLDIFIGGTKGYSGQLYLQQIDGSFFKKEEAVFNQFIDFEDGDIVFFDADKDGDYDLFISPGGNNNMPSSRQMQLRFFKNDGYGNFALDITALPVLNNGANIGAVTVCDLNGDGYEDLFVGARSTPQNYGAAPQSYVFINDGKGHFTDIAIGKNSDIANIGMVTSAVWANVSGDNEKELIITGEWMATHIFSFKNNHLEEIKTNLSTLSGWWQTVVAGDVNGDGKTDLILGNAGENFYLRPSKEKPIKLWMYDFDQNGSTDKIITQTVDGKDMPVLLKHDLEEQIPSIKKKSLRHEVFAKKSIQELFSKELMAKCKINYFNFCSSVVAINNGGGNFTLQPMPVMAQLSSINAIKIIDVNQDEFPDLVLGGNKYGFTPQFGRLDGSFGGVLLNDGKGNFKWVEPQLTGLNINGEVKDIVELNYQNKSSLLFLLNNDYPVLYQLKGIVK